MRSIAGSAVLPRIHTLHWPEEAAMRLEEDMLRLCCGCSYLWTTGFAIVHALVVLAVSSGLDSKAALYARDVQSWLSTFSRLYEAAAVPVGFVRLHSSVLFMRLASIFLLLTSSAHLLA